jgi:hypothetical protein
MLGDSLFDQTGRDIRPLVGISLVKIFFQAEFVIFPFDGEVVTAVGQSIQRGLDIA